MKTQQHYYLKDSKIMKGTEMPQKPCYKVIWDAEGDETWNEWLYSLQPCEISSIEMDKIEMYLSKNMSTYFDCTTPIDVTDIVEEIDKFQEICSICHKTIKEQAKGCNLIECYKGRPNYKRVELFFKQPSDNNGVITFKQPK